MVTITRINGCELNNNDKVVNGILRALEKNDGICPCGSNSSSDKRCPCSNYRDNGHCCCGLYVRKSDNGIKYEDNIPEW